MSSTPFSPKNNLNLSVDVKYECMENMVTPFRTLQQIYQDKNLTNEEKIEVRIKTISI